MCKFCCPSQFPDYSWWQSFCWYNVIIMFLGHIGFSVEDTQEVVVRPEWVEYLLFCWKFQEKKLKPIFNSICPACYSFLWFSLVWLGCLCPSPSSMVQSDPCCFALLITGIDFLYCFQGESVPFQSPQYFDSASFWLRTFAVISMVVCIYSYLNVYCSCEKYDILIS